ncbi:MAG: type II secretion system GspH family protein [Anaerohalosphaeraceae bacterium]|nr:type II secretion system GspH family protein [Anaerohalosphaeraceae bacterium]
MRGAKEKGFTLIEMIAASVILCAAVLALSSLSVRAMSAVTLNRQYETAIELAQKQLVIIDYIGIDKFIEAGKTEGRFEDKEPVFSWQVSAEPVGIDNLYQVKVIIEWFEKRKNYEVVIETRLNSKSEILQEEQQKGETSETERG